MKINATAGSIMSNSTIKGAQMDLNKFVSLDKLGTDFSHIKVGDLVLYEYGKSFSSDGYGYSLTKVSKVLPTGFRIEKESDGLFDLTTGRKKGKTHSMDMGKHSKCYLVTDSQAQEIRTIFGQYNTFLRLKNEVLTKLGQVSFDPAISVALEDLRKVLK